MRCAACGHVTAGHAHNRDMTHGWLLVELEEETDDFGIPGNSKGFQGILENS
jgi:hypothetical protein